MRLRLIAAVALALSGAYSAQAQIRTSPVGLWWTEDRSGVIAIASCGDALCGRIVGQRATRKPDGSLPVDVRGVAHCGLMILHDATPSEPGHWRGRITNPEDGQDWRCEFFVGDDGALRLRGYVLVPLLGQTQIWPPFAGRVQADCTIG
jgi:uncharacterized protein (DUF2147 family)